MSKVRVDWDLCESNGVCEALAPEMFELDDDDMLQVSDPTVTDANRSSVERAVASCPKSALRIVES
ncbi:ferredoxin [Nocardioides sp. Kera G14]|uniref:ferredoxin n=1 Tax=Nocardioides sp. Kera G14 TaxID=2884264 RepID=UPI001D0FB7AA|nr:ferredoxin [Nocardioides sp. Kera G14]UDY22299.1 ferredoxin [Nocardioides sp. Kera G14]